MQNTNDFLEDINTTYSQLEFELDEKLKKILSEEQRMEKVRQLNQEQFKKKKHEIQQTICTNLECAKKRNHDLIKSLEITKARLRSKATYSPLELVLEKAINNYVKDLNGNCIEKYYGPTFV